MDWRSGKMFFVAGWIEQTVEAALRDALGSINSVIRVRVWLLRIPRQGSLYCFLSASDQFYTSHASSGHKRAPTMAIRVLTRAAMGAYAPV